MEVDRSGWEWVDMSGYEGIEVDRRVGGDWIGGWIGVDISGYTLTPQNHLKDTQNKVLLVVYSTFCMDPS